MSDSMRDEDLDAFVRELNRTRPEAQATTADAAGVPRDGAAAARTIVGEGDPLEKVLTHVVRRDATDLLLVPGSPPALRVAGRLEVLGAPAMDEEDVRSAVAPHVSAQAWRALQEHGSADFSLRVTSSTNEGAHVGFRFRSNLHRQRGRLAVAIRILPRGIPTLAALGLPSSLADLVKPARGLVLVCGPTGAGKTSTLAALVGEINRSRTCHVVTIEEPVEYEHPNVRSNRGAGRGRRRRSVVRCRPEGCFAAGSRCPLGRRDARPGDDRDRAHRRRNGSPGSVNASHG